MAIPLPIPVLLIFRVSEWWLQTRPGGGKLELFCRQFADDFRAFLTWIMNAATRYLVKYTLLSCRVVSLFIIFSPKNLSRQVDGRVWSANQYKCSPLCHTTGRPALANCPDTISVVSAYLYAQVNRLLRSLSIAVNGGIHIPPSALCVNFAAVNV